MSTKEDQILIQNRINELTTAIDAGDTDVQLSLWEMERTDKRKELARLLEEEANQQQRVQVQTEKVESITLPLDFNDLLDNPLANEMIIEVVKQFQLQAYDEHNAEVARINADWKSRFDEIGNDYEKDIDLFNKRISDLEAELESEKGSSAIFARMADAEKARADQYQHDLYLSDLDKNQALLYRDNAVAQLGERQDVINSQAATITELQQELTTKKAFTVNGNDKLAELASKAKESTIEKANRGLARWNLPAIEVPSTPEHIAPLETPALQEVHTHTPQESTNHDVHSGGIAATEGNQTVHELVQQAEENTTEAHTVTRAEHDALVARVERIEIQANIKAVA